VDTLEMEAALVRAAQYTLHVVLTAHTGGVYMVAALQVSGVTFGT
jgi:hypothetical protein